MKKKLAEKKEKEEAKNKNKKKKKKEQEPEPQEEEQPVEEPEQPVEDHDSSSESEVEVGAIGQLVKAARAQKAVEDGGDFVLDEQVVLIGMKLDDAWTAEQKQSLLMRLENHWSELDEEDTGLTSVATITDLMDELLEEEDIEYSQAALQKRVEALRELAKLDADGNKRKKKKKEKSKTKGRPEEEVAEEQRQEDEESYLSFQQYADFLIAHFQQDESAIVEELDDSDIHDSDIDADEVKAGLEEAAAAAMEEFEMSEEEDDFDEVADAADAPAPKAAVPDVPDDGLNDTIEDIRSQIPDTPLLNTDSFVRKLRKDWALLTDSDFVSRRALRLYLFPPGSESERERTEAEIDFDLDTIILGATGGSNRSGLTIYQFATLLLYTQNVEVEIMSPERLERRENEEREKDRRRKVAEESERAYEAANQAMMQGDAVAGYGAGATKWRLKHAYMVSHPRPDSFDIVSASEAVREQLPAELNAAETNQFMATVEQHFRPLDADATGRGSLNRLKRFLWRTGPEYDGDMSLDPEQDIDKIHAPEPLPPQTEALYERMTSGSSAPLGYITYLDVLEYFAREAGFELIETPKQLLRLRGFFMRGGGLSVDDFDLERTLHEVYHQLASIKELDLLDFLARLRDQYGALDSNNSGVVSRQDVRQFVWSADHSGACPEQLPPELEVQVRSLMYGTSPTGDPGDFFTFWDFANFLLAGEGIEDEDGALAPAEVKLVPVDAE